jgi:hypothetical protein
MDADDYSEPWKKVDGVIEWLHFSPNYVIFQIQMPHHQMIFGV